MFADVRKFSNFWRGQEEDNNLGCEGKDGQWCGLVDYAGYEVVFLTTFQTLIQPLAS